VRYRLDQDNVSCYITGVFSLTSFEKILIEVWISNKWKTEIATPPKKKPQRFVEGQ